MSKICSEPKCGRPHLANNFCEMHYWRDRRRGTTERLNMSRKGLCTDPSGCSRVIHAKRLCNLHYEADRGPLYTIWRNIRSRAGEPVHESWQTFDGFRASVGERPGEKYQLRRIDKEQPWGPDNFEWRPPVVVEGRTGLTANMAVYQLAWKYSRKFGLTMDDVAEIARVQDHRCPICSDALEAPHPETGKVQRVTLDHCHRTNAVRGLIHDRCNKALGALNDDPAACRRAADYLEFHAGIGEGE